MAEMESDVGKGADTDAEPVPVAAPGIGVDTLNRMLDIIAEHQEQSRDQQKLIAELTRRLGNQQTGFGMVAEDIHHRE